MSIIVMESYQKHLFVVNKLIQQKQEISELHSFRSRIKLVFPITKKHAVLTKWKDIIHNVHMGFAP